MNTTEQATKYWNQAFAAAARDRVGLVVQNVNPKPSAGSRNIFADDRKYIEAAAAQVGYIQVGSIGKTVSYIPGDKHPANWRLIPVL